MRRNSISRWMERLRAGWRVVLGNRRVYAWLLIAVGAALRLRLYFEFLSMGNDEAALSRNIAQRDILGLTQPLDYRQGAPILFLFIQKLAITIFGNRDYVLAIFPLIAALLALYFFYRISDRYLGWWGLIALFAFAYSRQIIDYSSVQKQYSSDVLIAVLLIHLHAELSSRQPRARDFALFGFIGAAAIWLSHPAALVLPGIGLVMLIRGRTQRDRQFVHGALGAGTAWAISLALNFLVSLRGLAANTYFETYWADAFMPRPIWANPGWFAETYASLVYMGINRTDAALLWGWLVLLALGTLALWARQRPLALILISMFAVSLTASAVHLYPLRWRLLLFLLPAVYLMLAAGVRGIFEFISKFNLAPARLVSAAVCIGLLWPGVVDAKRIIQQPVRLYDMRGIVQHVQQNWNDGDAILVSGGGETFAYYAESLGLKPGAIIVDTNHRIIRYGSFLEYLDRLSMNKRVWVIFAHFEPDPSYTRYSDYLEKQGSVGHVETIGFARCYLWISKQIATNGNSTE